MPSPDDIDFLVLRAIAHHYERGTVARETLRQAAEPRRRTGFADAELDAALARLRSGGHVVARDGRYAVSPAVAAVLPRTKSWLQAWSSRPGRSRTHDPSFSQGRPRLGCRRGTFRPSRRRIN